MFIDTQYFYLYILTGFFSRNESELFQRLVTYFQALVECWEYFLDIAEDEISYAASKGDGYLMRESELIDLVKWQISSIGCGFEIYPTLIRGKHFEEKEFYVNFLKIVEDQIYTNRIFIRFRTSRFSKEAKERLIAEVKTRTKPD